MSTSREIITAHPLTPNKALGQNFLVDEAVIARIVYAALEPRVPIIEIGPGLGALTRPLAESGLRIAAVELDSALCRILEAELPGNVSVINADFLKADLEKIHASLGGDGLTFVGNLPYYVTSPIVSRLVSCGLPIRRMVLMMQKEAADRFFAKPKDKNYVPLSVLAQLKYSAGTLLELSPASYWPQPEVASAVLVFDPKEVSLPAKLPGLLKCAFSMRRKTLVNNLSGFGLNKKEAAALLDRAGLSAGVRAEELTPGDFLRLAELC